MVDLDAATLTTTEINARIRELAANGTDEIRILNPQAKHNIVVGILNACKITIEGSVGYYSSSLMDGPEVTINGNAGWAVGENLMGGKIVVTKDVGALEKHVAQVNADPDEQRGAPVSLQIELPEGRLRQHLAAHGAHGAVEYHQVGIPHGLYHLAAVPAHTVVHYFVVPP